MMDRLWALLKCHLVWSRFMETARTGGVIKRWRRRRPTKKPVPSLQREVPRAIHLHRNAVKGAFENPQFKWEPQTCERLNLKRPVLGPDGLYVGSPKGPPSVEHGRG